MTDPAPNPNNSDPDPSQDDPQLNPDPAVDNPDDDNPNAEAAKYRTRLRAAEKERDDLQELLHKTLSSVVDSACAAAKLDRRLWNAANVDLSTLQTSDGVLDLAKVTDHAATLRAEMVGTPMSNPQQGGGGASNGKTSWADVIKSA